MHCDESDKNLSVCTIQIEKLICILQNRSLSKKNSMETVEIKVNITYVKTFFFIFKSWLKKLWHKKIR